MSWEWILGIWTGVGVAWWVVTLVLVSRRARLPRPGRGDPDRRRLTVFKALASPLRPGEARRLADCLESFIADLDDESELLIGVHERDAGLWRPFVGRMRRAHPDADVRLVEHRDPNHHANPKVSWMEILAHHATGELWLWSDSDMKAPRGTLRSLREDFGAAGAGSVTSPYIVREVASSADLLDTLFVNLEFYPGAVLLERLNLIRFGFGSGMLFEAGEFRERVDWELLGGCLAEDFHLGRLLAPARLGTACLSTVPASASWLDAVVHYLRWKKTIRWCRPGSFAAQLIVLPQVGWLTALLLSPASPLLWAGLGAVLAADSVAAVAVCRRLGCPVGLGRLFAVPLWSLLRAGSWVACWLPWPIVWRGKRWWSPWRRPRTEAAALEAEGQAGVE